VRCILPHSGLLEMQLQSSLGFFLCLFLVPPRIPEPMGSKARDFGLPCWHTTCMSPRCYLMLGLSPWRVQNTWWQVLWGTGSCHPISIAAQAQWTAPSVISTVYLPDFSTLHSAFPPGGSGASRLASSLAGWGEN
jgi:hypothetical protein